LGEADMTDGGLQTLEEVVGEKEERKWGKVSTGPALMNNSLPYLDQPQELFVIIIIIIISGAFFYFGPLIRFT